MNATAVRSAARRRHPGQRRARRPHRRRRTGRRADSGKLRAAGIDAYNNEPNVDPRLIALPNTFLMPHIGSATRETRDAMGFRALDNLDAFFAGREPGDRVA